MQNTEFAKSIERLPSAKADSISCDGCFPRLRLRLRLGLQSGRLLAQAHSCGFDKAIDA